MQLQLQHFKTNYPCIPTYFVKIYIVQLSNFWIEIIDVLYSVFSSLLLRHLQCALQ